MPEIDKEAPIVEAREGFIKRTAGGTPLIFTQVDIEDVSGNMITLKFMVGANSLSIPITKGAIPDFLIQLGAVMGL